MNKKRRIILLFLVLIVVGASLWTLSQRGASTRSVSGTIETDEVRVASRYGGRVARILPQEGDALKAGDVIVELDADELKAQRDQAASVWEELKNGPRSREIAAASNDWQSLVAQLQFARAEESRARELFIEKTISVTERDSALSRAAALEGSVAAAKQRFDLLVDGTRPERLEQGRAQLAQFDAQWRELRIVAPTNCVLEVLNVKVGDVLPPNREVATVLLVNHLWVRVYVPETWLGHIQLGQQVKVRIDAFPGRDFSGTVEQINRHAEFTPRNVQTVADRIRQVFGVKVRLDNTGDFLRAGSAADVFFPNVTPLPK